MSFTITFPPGLPALDYEQFIAPGSGWGPYFAHVKFSEGYVYGLIFPFHHLQALQIYSYQHFCNWLPDFVKMHIAHVPRAYGRKNALLVLGPDGMTMRVVNIMPYPQVIAETRLHKPAQAVEFFYFPPVWVGTSAESPDRNVDFEAMSERVFQSRLAVTGIQVAATRDGQFVIDFSDWAPASLPDFEAGVFGDPQAEERRFVAHGLRISVANIFLTCLQSVCWTHRHRIPTPAPITLQKIHHKIGVDNRGGGGSSRAFFGMDVARGPRGYDPQLPHGFDWKIGERSTTRPIQLEHLKQALELLDAILAMPIAKGLQRVELYGHASIAFGENNFSLALNEAWLACESILTEMWKDHRQMLPPTPAVPTPAGTTKRKRRQRKISGQRPPISAIIQELSNARLLSPDLLKNLEAARNARNGLMHELKQPALETAEKALVALEHLLEQVGSIRLQVPHRPSRGGFALEVTR